MTLWEITVQLIGYVGLTFAVIAFQCKTHKKVMLFRTLNELIFSVQYLCMGSYTGVVMNVLGSVRNMGFASCVERNKSTKFLQILFSIAFVILGLLTSNGLISLMVIIAKVVTTIAYGMKDTKYIRFLTLPTSICWLIYNIACGSTAGILSESFTICSIATAIIRMDLPIYMKRFGFKKSIRV